MPFKEVVAEVIGEMEGEDWGQGSAMEAAFALDPGGRWVAPAGWMGQGGSLDGTRGNPRYVLFPHEWLAGVWAGTGGADKAGVVWDGDVNNSNGWRIVVCVYVRTYGAWRVS
jgi:hypothetical protein